MKTCRGPVVVDPSVAAARAKDLLAVSSLERPEVVFIVHSIQDNGMDSNVPEAVTATFKEAMHHANVIAEHSEMGSEGTTIHAAVIGKTRCVVEVATSWGSKPLTAMKPKNLARAIKVITAAIAKNAAKTAAAKAQAKTAAEAAAEAVDSTDEDEDDDDEEDEDDEDEDEDEDKADKEDEDIEEVAAAAVGIASTSTSSGTSGPVAADSAVAGDKRSRE